MKPRGECTSLRLFCAVRGKEALCGFLLPEKGFERGDKYDTESFIHDGYV